MTFRPLILLFHAAVLLPAAHADTLSVESLVRSALVQNPEAAFYEARIAAAKSERADAGRRPNPQLGVQLGSWSVRGAGDGPMWQAAMSQTFEWPGRLNLRKAIADGQTEMAELGLAAFRNALASEVRASAVDMMMAQEKAAAAAAASDRIAAVVAVLVQRDPTGPAPLLESRILEATLITLSRDAALARKRVASHMTDLNLLRGARPETEFAIAPAGLDLPAVPELEALLKAARLSNFDLRMRQLDLRQQGFAVNLARNERGPDISVQPFVNSQKAGNQRETIAGLSVNVPLPLWNDGKARVGAEEARLQQARVSMEVALREVDSRIVTKRREYAALAAELGKWRDDSLARLREAAEQGDRHYQLGAIPVATYIELQKSYLEALGALLDTRAEALAALLELELLSGLTLRPAAR